MCHEASIHVTCESFDGQSLKNEPLTILQLQKDVWAEVQKMKKTDIVTGLKQFNHNPIIINETTRDQNLHSNTICVRKSHCRDCKAVNNNAETTSGAVDRSANVEYDNFEVEGNDVPKHVDGLECSEDLETEVDDDKEVHEERNSNDTNCDTERQGDIEEVSLDEADIQQVLLMLRVDEVCNSKKKWDSVSVRTVMDYFQSTNSLNKLLNSELTVVLRYLKQVKRISNIHPQRETKFCSWRNI
ncbi:hypothetical protein MAR_005722 [Mya arenaria]|uniref:Uncharacterized protein n=1 Tax=Mya arenaria TaxID=6604 RepID=A0ABY7F1Y3_MYAAR|nr:hypothetical protein MAR_005722 [Mya arenaria]